MKLFEKVAGVNEHPLSIFELHPQNVVSLGLLLFDLGILLLGHGDGDLEGLVALLVSHNLVSRRYGGKLRVR